MEKIVEALLRCRDGGISYGSLIEKIDLALHIGQLSPSVATKLREFKDKVLTVKISYLKDPDTLDFDSLIAELELDWRE